MTNNPTPTTPDVGPVVPVLTPQQAEAARLARLMFKPIPEDDDEVIDHGF
jgi:hypothetical protein